MYSNLGSQNIILYREDYHDRKYILNPHDIDITDLIEQHELVTDRSIWFERRAYPSSRPYHIDRLYFVYDNENPKDEDKYYILRNFGEYRDYGVRNLLAILKVNKETKKKESVSNTDYLSKSIWWGTMFIVSLLAAILIQDHPMKQIMIVPAVIGLVPMIISIVKMRKVKKNSYRTITFPESTEIIGFRTIENIDIDVIARALDLGYEDRIKKIFNVPEEYLTKHLNDLKQEIDIKYEIEAAKINPIQYVQHYSPEQLRIMDEIEHSQDKN